ncbi:MAG: DUF29 domain-containing protein [Cyanobacteria bacterium SW_9_44_58]|nr:MAG: DUF29 domain-containing protein [Cyanobacteria bacterium SW_9_44_58]
MKLVTLYETDYQRWIEKTLNQLGSHNFNNIDLENLIEELDSLGRSEKRAIASYLMRLCEHLLKIKYWDSQRNACIRGWNVEIANFRIQIQEYLEASPSLKQFLEENFVKQYCNGRKLFLKASEIDPGLIPETPEFTLEQALDEDWLPEHD